MMPREGEKGRIVIAGGSGFLGQSLIGKLVKLEYEPVVLTRGGGRVDGRVRYVSWDGRGVGDWVHYLNGATAIVNLVGRSVDCRKTELNKQEILESRINSVNALSEGCRRANDPPRVWVQSGTAHIYGDTQEQILDESSPIGTGFAPEVGVAWEKALNDAPVSCRRVILRISFVLGRDGGALGTLAGLAKWFLGGRIGNGRQYVSWIHVDDLDRIILRAIEKEMSGVYVVTAPQPVTNEQFMNELRRVLKRPWSPPVPEALVRLGSMFMRNDPELALYGRRCMPTRLMAEGFDFVFPELRPALADLLGKR